MNAIQAEKPVATPAILGDYHVTNWMPFIPRDTVDGFSILCRETPMRAIWITTTIIAGFSVGFIFLILRFADDRNWIWFAVLLGLATTLGFHFATIAYHRHHQKLGPILNYDAPSNAITLPRSNHTLKRQELEHVVIVNGSGGGSDYIAQLQLHTRDARKLLLVSAWTIPELLPMARTIAGSHPSSPPHLPRKIPPKATLGRKIHWRLPVGGEVYDPLRRRMYSSCVPMKNQITVSPSRTPTAR